MATDFSGQQIGNLCVARYRRYAARIGEVHILTVLSAFFSKDTIKSLQVADQFPPFHLHLELLDHNLALGEFG